MDGIRFDSKMEAGRYAELAMLQKGGAIKELSVHPKFQILWPGTDSKICTVELDFSYFDKSGKRHIEDVKGFDTALSKLKRKLVCAAHGIEVELIK